MGLRFLEVGFCLLTAIKGCFASLWTTRVLAYRRKVNFKDDEVQAVVVIMEMVEAKAAGVGFTCDPRTGLPHPKR